MIVTRFHNVEKLTLGVEFLSPTFLGGADQNAELRSAPFKNLLRQWWRVANGQLPPDRLREEEGKLFGTVLGEDNSQASQVRLVLEKNKPFDIKRSLPTLQPKLNHPNVNVPVDRLLYLGYGPISKTVREFINPGSMAKFSIYLPKISMDIVLSATSLLHHFGTIGSRCRNGFGSFALDGKKKISITPLNELIRSSIPFDVRMGQSNKKYPSQLCSDGKLLCWEYIPNSSETEKAWQDILKNFAEIYMRARTQFEFRAANQLEK